MPSPATPTVDPSPRTLATPRRSAKRPQRMPLSERDYPAGPWGDALAELCGPLPGLVQVQAIDPQQTSGSPLDVAFLSPVAATYAAAQAWYQAQLPPGLAQAVENGDDAAVARLYQTSAEPDRLADWVQSLSSHDCWAKTFFVGKRRRQFVDRRFSQLVMVPLVLPAEFGPHALSYSRFMPVRQWLTQRTQDWIGHRHLLTWMGVAMDLGAVCRFGPSSWRSLLQRLRICVGPLTQDDGWPGLLDFKLPSDAPRLWFMVGSIVNTKGWLTRVALDAAHDGLVRADIASGLQMGLDAAPSSIQVGQLALARQALPAGLSAWLEALHRWQPLQVWTMEPGPQDVVFLHLWFASTLDGPWPQRREESGSTEQSPLADSPDETGRPGWQSTISLRRLHFDQAGWQALLSTLGQWPHRRDAHSPVLWNLDRSLAAADGT